MGCTCISANKTKKLESGKGGKAPVRAGQHQQLEKGEAAQINVNKVEEYMGETSALSAKQAPSPAALEEQNSAGEGQRRQSRQEVVIISDENVVSGSANGLSKEEASSDVGEELNKKPVGPKAMPVKSASPSIKLVEGEINFASQPSDRNRLGDFMVGDDMR